MSPLLEEFIQAVVGAIFDAILSHLPELDAEWNALHTTTAVDSAAPPASVLAGVNAEIFAAQAAEAAR